MTKTSETCVRAQHSERKIKLSCSSYSSFVLFFTLLPAKCLPPMPTPTNSYLFPDYDDADWRATNIVPRTKAVAAVMTTRHEPEIRE